MRIVDKLADYCKLFIRDEASEDVRLAIRFVMRPENRHVA